jgi:hypothetical protein
MEAESAAAAETAVRAERSGHFETSTALRAEAAASRGDIFLDRPLEV